MTDRYAQLFDFDEGQRLKVEGLTQAAEQVPTLLEKARQIAVELCRERGSVHADAVSRVMRQQGLDDLGPAAGSVFKGKQWVWTGEWHVSARIANHGRLQRVWRLKP